MTRKRQRMTRGVAVIAAFVTIVAACGSDDSEANEAASEPSDGPVETSEESSGETSEAVSLEGICPDKIVLQTDWFPESDHGYSYQLIGPGGTIDAGAGTYTGPLLDPSTGVPTGVELEIRAGGPFIGFQPPVAQMYSDEAIFIAYADTADQVRNSGKLPTVAVMAPLNKSPQILMFDPEQHDFTSFADIGDSGAKVLYFEGSVYMDYLVAQGFIDPDQLDGSFDGSFATFVAEEGAPVMQGYATREPYELEHNTPGWNKPVDYLLVDDAGYRIYQSALVVRPETVTEYHDCLSALVPLFQQGMVEYIADPQPINDELINIVDTMGTFWTLSPGGNEFTVDQALSLDIWANSPDGSYGTFDDARVQSVIDAVLPIFEGQNLDSFDPDVAPGDLVTNEFVDVTISLP